MYRSLLLALSLIWLTSCQERIQGNGNVQSETRETAPFKSIDVSGAFDVIIKPANYSSLTIEADENLLQHIETYVDNEVLHVSAKKNFSRYRKLQLNISVNEFKGIEASGASEIKSDGNLKGKKVKLDFSGAVEAHLEINAEELEGDFSGASELNLRGNANQMHLDVDGASEINAGKFKTKKCGLDMSGAGEIEVYVTELLDIDVSGAAEVRYRGNPGEVN